MGIWGLSFDQILALFGILLLGSVLASKASAKLGIPALVLFIVLGMIAGSDGPGGLRSRSPRHDKRRGHDKLRQRMTQPKGDRHELDRTTRALPGAFGR